MTSWADHAILWHVYPLGFTGAERAALPAHEPVSHRLRQLEAWLDYAIELGSNGLLLGPYTAALLAAHIAAGTPGTPLPKVSNELDPARFS